MTTINTGIIGCGFMGKIHAENIIKIPHAKLTAVCKFRSPSAREFARKYDAALFSSPDQLFKDANIHAVIISVPTPFHCELTIQALTHGKHVFLEKPIAGTLKEAEEILRTHEESKNILMVGHVLRFFQEYVHIKNLMDSGRAGKIGTARTARRARFPQGSHNWYANRRMSGGVLLDMMIHDFDFLRWCFGEVKEVYARSISPDVVQQTDFAVAMLQFNSGVIAHCEGSWAYEGEFHSTFEAAGDMGLITYNSLETSPIQAAYKHDQVRAKVALPKSPLKHSPYLLELKHFFECIPEGKVPSIKVSEAVEAIRISLSAIQSAKSGKPVILH